MHMGLDANSSSTACSFSMKLLSLLCLGLGGGGGPMGTTSALMCRWRGGVAEAFSACGEAEGLGLDRLSSRSLEETLGS